MQFPNFLFIDTMEILYFLTMTLIEWLQRVRGCIVRLLLKPMTSLLKRQFKEIGVVVNGDKPHDIKVHDKEFFYRIAQDNTLGLGESYMDGLWDCDKLDEFFNLAGSNSLYAFVRQFPEQRLFHYLRFYVFNLQTAKRSWEVAEKHYDLGNKLYENFLDETMTYTCAYWKGAKNLKEAQLNKMELIGKKLKLKPGMRVLELGCGWGGLCKYLAETYKVHMTGVTNSREGAKYGQELCQGLSVDIQCKDYRDVTGSFDAVVAVGILEHVGRKNYRSFFELAARCLPKHGIFLCHCIGFDNEDVPAIEPWMNTYIFPGGILPDHREITGSIHNLFTIEDWHNIGPDYDKTLMAWNENFVRNWSKISHLFADPKRFYRMWTYYLLSCAGLFRSRKFQLWQIVLTKGGLPGGYESVR